MKRLTKRDEYGNADIVGVVSAELQLSLDFDEMNIVTDALNRLAAYEDTGLTPERVSELQNAFDILYKSEKQKQQEIEQLKAENERIKKALTHQLSCIGKLRFIKTETGTETKTETETD